jgi:replicative superfamily II helicase
MVGRRSRPDVATAGSVSIEACLSCPYVLTYLAIARILPYYYVTIIRNSRNGEAVLGAGLAVAEIVEWLDRTADGSP